jgi:O-antigen/teichoic acid export membrane protein
MSTTLSIAAEPGDDVAPPLRARAVRGAMWTMGGAAAGQFIRLGGNLVLAWLLFREAFGLMALVAVFMQGLEMLSDLGIGPSIIQNRRGDETVFLNTAWTIQVIRGIALWVCACILAWPLAALYAGNDPAAWQLTAILPVAGLSAVAAGFLSTNWYTLNRHLLIGRLTLVQLVSHLAGVAMMIGWALVHRSVWALVVGGVVMTTTKTILSHVWLPVSVDGGRAGIRNRFSWDGQSFHAIFHFGKWVFVSSAVTFVALQADRLLLGALVPLALLGVYSFGFGLSMMALEIVTHLGTVVLFPALAQHGRSRRADLRHKLRMARGALLQVAAFIVLGVVLIAPMFFQLLYPVEFHDAGWIAQLLSATVWIALLAATADRALLAIGDTRSLAASNMANLVVAVPAALGGFHQFGLPGFILGYAAGRLAALVVIHIALRRAGLSVAMQDVKFTLLLAALAGVGIAAMARAAAWSADAGVAGPLIAQVLVAGVVLAAHVALAARQTLSILFPAAGAPPHEASRSGVI